jgi:hypothetical protein
LALTVVWKLSYAILNGLLPIHCEFSGLDELDDPDLESDPDLEDDADPDEDPDEDKS